MMIDKHGFLKGDVVEFQNSNRCWTRGTVVQVEWAETKIEGPGGRLVEKTPSQVHIRFLDPFRGGYRVVILPKKRVRAVPKEASA